MIIKKSSSTFHPIHVQIEVTWKCNWRCVHCYQDDHSAEMLSKETLKNLFNELANNGTLHVILTGGEPLLRNDIFELLKAVKGYNMGVTLYTNGHLITEQLAKELKPYVANVEISLLAGTATLHDALSKVKGSFQRAVSAIHSLKENNIPVLVKTPILKPALASLKALEEMLYQWGVEWTADPEISRSYAGEAYPLAYQLSYTELQAFFRDFPQFNRNNGFNSDPGVVNGMCLAGRQYCFIDAFGNVYPCLNFKSACDVQESKGQQPLAKLGNIHSQSFTEIWQNSSGVKTIRAATRNDFKTCSNCSSGSGCSPCMALNYEENGELFNPAPSVCAMTKAAKSLFDVAFKPASELTAL